jgi:hypothetical protein
MKKHTPTLLVALALPLLAGSAFAETIDGQGQPLTYSSNGTGTTTKVCGKVVFILRNSGTLVTGLTKSNVKVVSASMINEQTSVQSDFSVTVTLTATPPAGAYTLCVAPSGTSTWTANPPFATLYEFVFIVNGTNAADNGAFTYTLTNI